MIRRQIRLRKEYLYRRSLLPKEREEYEKKLKIKEAFREGRPLPTELKHSNELFHQVELEDEATSISRDDIDDEYIHSNSVPKGVVTTSHNPGTKLKQFSKEVRLMFPNYQKINRGNMKLSELVSVCQKYEIDNIIIVHETRGTPDGMIICHLPLGPTAYFSVSNAVLRHDIQSQHMTKMSEVYPHLIFNNFQTKLGKRIQTIINHLYPISKPESKRIITFSNESDTISFRHHIYKKTKRKGNKSKDEVKLTEIGPRFELRLYKLVLGTVDQPEARVEWVLRPYMNTAKRRKFI